MDQGRAPGARHVDDAVGETFRGEATFGGRAGAVRGEGFDRIRDAAPRGRGARLYDWYTRLSQTDLSRLRRAPIEHSMLLEDQQTADRDAEARLDETVRETNPRLFWD